MHDGDALPRWMDLLLLPLINLTLAMTVAGLVVWGVGQDPWQVLTLLVKGAFGSRGLKDDLAFLHLHGADPGAVPCLHIHV